MKAAEAQTPGIPWEADPAALSRARGIRGPLAHARPATPPAVSTLDRHYNAHQNPHETQHAREARERGWGEVVDATRAAGVADGCGVAMAMTASCLVSAPASLTLSPAAEAAPGEAGVLKLSRKRFVGAMRWRAGLDGAEDLMGRQDIVNSRSCSRNISPSYSHAFTCRCVCVCVCVCVRACMVRRSGWMQAAGGRRFGAERGQLSAEAQPGPKTSGS